MSNTKGRKLVSLILAALMASSAFTVAVSAEESGTTGSTLASIGDVLSTISYREYLASHSDKQDAKQSVKIDVADYNREQTTAEVELLDDYNGKSGIKTGDKGKVTFNINVPESALYALRLSYCPVSQKTNTIERVMYVNGSVPYSEARNVHLKKSWVSEYVEQEDGSLRFKKDTAGNEVTPSMSVDMVWSDYVFTDANGYYTEPLRIYLEKGENTISFEAVREGVVLSDFELFQYSETKSYADVKAEYEKKGYKNVSAEPIYISAETPSAVSDYQITPQNDQVSAKTEPQSASNTLYNTIGDSRWSGAGEWIEYKFTVEESGLYSIATRFKANGDNGTYVSRKLYIDGEVPFTEAGNVKFASADKWQLAYLSDGEEELNFYLEKGEHTIRFEVTLGEFGAILTRMSAVRTALNSDYLEILRLTGANPDEYRDYGFMRVMPDTLKDLADQATELYSIVEYIEELNGKSDTTTTLTQIADLANRMGRDEDKVAGNLESLKSYLGTLSTLITSLESQPLTFDYILVQSSETKLGKADAGFFTSVIYEFNRFFQSFFTDYNALSSITDEAEATGEPIEVWTNKSREMTQIVKNIVDSKFVPESGIPTTIKLVDSSTFLPSVLAGIGPDVALDGLTTSSTTLSSMTATSSGSIIDYAVRGAVLDLQDRDGFDEVKSRVNETVFEPVSLYGKTYGVPVSFGFDMMFYRSDILSELGLEIPQTWDELLATIPVLQFNNMDVGIAADVGGFARFIYQNGGEFWADDGMRVNFDDNTTLEAFETLCNMFTQYSLPLSFDVSNRFRTGELPLFVADYLTYNNIVIFATELAGLWGFTSVPGTLQEDGTIDHTTIGSTDAVIMPRGCTAEDESWEFIKWYSDKDYQVEYANEIVTVLGEAGKNNPANLEALEELSWTQEEYSALMEQAQHVVCLTQYPGSYFVGRYIKFGIQNAYNEGADPVESILGYMNSINKEISRKRSEFGYETLEVGQTLSEKRQKQATEVLDGLSEENAAKYADDISEVREALKIDDSEYTAKIDALMRSASILKEADSELFSDAVQYLRDAADAIKSYHD